MAGRIPQDFIDDLIQRADIVEIISARVQLKKAGREYKAPCPFHNEKTPSFTVSPQKGFYHCFGCGAHGTALGFLMEFDRLEFPEAVEELAQSLGLQVPRDESAEKRTPVAPVYDILTRAAEIYRQALRDHQSAIDYLKNRGLTGETVAAFGIGYAPGGWDYLLRHFDERDETRRNLKSAGLIAERDSGGHYDRFRERIIFPIRDSRGRTVGFGGRITGDGEPKYLNSPETPAFHKGRELYGFFEARRAHRKLGRVLVVEGYMDVVSLAQQGITNAVATLGTATTPEHLHRLFRATQEVVFCFDGDRAGREAAWRALQTSLPEMRDGRQVRFLFLPDGEDPDSLVRSEGAQAFARRLEQTMPLSDYLFSELAGQVDIDSMDGRARLAELVRPLLALLPTGVYRELLTERLASEVGLGRATLESVMGGERTPAGPARQRRAKRSNIAQGGRPSLVRQAIQVLLNFPQACAAVAAPPGLGRVSQRGADLLAELLGTVAAHPELGPAGLIERFRERPEGPHLEALLAEDMLIGEDGAAAQLIDNLERIMRYEVQHRLAELVVKANAEGLTDAEKDEFRNLQSENVRPT
ncbi:MAG: DNA primase [Gammaproteobacteria bacterium]|nr:DNA primase [Gammaproteobacteria bacterium]MBT8445380.1 DNA primase [Gammaproteobacteria bacterium]